MGCIVSVLLFILKTIKTAVKFVVKIVVWAVKFLINIGLRRFGLVACRQRSYDGGHYRLLDISHRLYIAYDLLPVAVYKKSNG